MKMEYNNRINNETIKPRTPKRRPSIRRVESITENSILSKMNTRTENTVSKNVQQVHKLSEILENNEKYVRYEDVKSNDVSDDSSDTEDQLIDSFSTARGTPTTQLYHRHLRASSVVQDSSLTYKSPRTEKRTLENYKEKSHISFITIILVISISALVSFTVAYSWRSAKEPNVESIPEADKLDQLLNVMMQKVKRRFHNQKLYIWNDILAGVYDVVLNKNKPAVITLFGNEADTMNCLAKLLGKVSGVVLGSNDYLSLTPKDFKATHGEVIYNLKQRIQQKKAVVIQDLLGIDAEALRAFHSLCDRENPLVGNAVYIITVEVNGYNSSQRELEFIEKQLRIKLSGKIDEDILNPLIIRITDGPIIPILHEPNAEGCYFSLQ